MCFAGLKNAGNSAGDFLGDLWGGWHRQPEIRPHGVAHRRHLYRLYQQRRAGGFIDGEFIYPGIHNGKPASDLLNLLDAEQVATQVAKVAERDGGDIAGVFLRMLPANIVAAASDDGQMLGVIIFSLLFGYFYCKPQNRGTAHN